MRVAQFQKFQTETLWTRLVLSNSEFDRGVLPAPATHKHAPTTQPRIITTFIQKKKQKIAVFLRFGLFFFALKRPEHPIFCLLTHIFV